VHFKLEIISFLQIELEIGKIWVHSQKGNLNDSICPPSTFGHASPLGANMELHNHHQADLASQCP
jgi:hypothetical protein